MFTERSSFWHGIFFLATFSLFLVEFADEDVIFGGGAPQGDPRAAWLADLLSSPGFVVVVVGVVLGAMAFLSFARWVVELMGIFLAVCLAVLQDRLVLWVTIFVYLLVISALFHFLYRVSTRLVVCVLVFTTTAYLLEGSAF